MSMAEAAGGDHKDLVLLFIEKGANDWIKAMCAVDFEKTQGYGFFLERGKATEIGSSQKTSHE
jgi:hypothetical protein